jgi:hypothetical protein
LFAVDAGGSNEKRYFKKKKIKINKKEKEKEGCLCWHDVK